MRRNLRWAAAGLVTALAFALPTWLCGAVFLPSRITDPAIRWSLSSTLGVVLATLAVTWGQGFAKQEDTPAPPPDGPVTASGERSIAVKGNPAGISPPGTPGHAVLRPVRRPRLRPPPRHRIRHNLSPSPSPSRGRGRAR